MARPPLLLLLLLILTAVSFDSCKAINCFSRSGTSSTDNGTALACGSATACYSVTSNGQNFAGCTSNGLCGTYAGYDCYVCSTDYCNSMTPSSISCFHRIGSSSSTDNGTVVACHSGVSACYSYMGFNGIDPQSGSLSYAGCGNISTNGNVHPVTCNSSLCNSQTPSAISCYAASRSPGSTSNGSAVPCPAGFKTCQIYEINAYTLDRPSYYRADCGSCNSTANPSCVTCSSDLCNLATPSAISCYKRALSSGSATSNGQPEACQHGISTCYSFAAFYAYQFFVYGLNYYGGCGACSPDTIPSCQTCTGDYCNTMDTGTLTCAIIRNGFGNIHVSCPRGINSCYSLTKPIGWLTTYSYNPLGGCGVCTPTTSALYGCTMCNTSNCNSVAPATTGSPANPSGNPTNSPSTGTAAGGFSCYNGFGETGVSSPQTVSCLSTSTCFDYIFSYGVKNFYFSGCGSCPFSSGADCRTCSSSLCNSPRRKSGTRCYFSFGDSAQSKSVVDCPSSSSCFSYTYNYGLAKLVFAGCGNCTFDSGTTNCRTCFTDLCNSGSALGCSAAAAAAAAAVVFGLNLMKLF